jgi:DNA-binding transcriptional MocR family regulator
MLDVTTTDTESITNKFTEQQAREYLAQNAGDVPPVRHLAAEWGWSKSTVSRFLSQLESEKHGTQPGTTAEQTPCPTPATATRVLASPAAPEFNWSADNPDITIVHQPAVAIYPNNYGQIVIRSENVEASSKRTHSFRSAASTCRTSSTS